MFLTLEATEVVLFIGNFAANANVVKIGGYVGVVTAARRLVHLGRCRGQHMRGGAPTLPVGKPLWAARPSV